MLRGRDPVGDGLAVFIGGLARVGFQDDLQEQLHMIRRQCSDVARDGGLVGRAFLELRVVDRLGFEGVESERDLERQRVLRPQGAVVVEDGDALDLGDEVRRSLPRRPLDELENRDLRRPLVPTGQGIARNGLNLGSALRQRILSPRELAVHGDRDHRGGQQDSLTHSAVLPIVENDRVAAYRHFKSIVTFSSVPVKANGALY